MKPTKFSYDVTIRAMSVRKQVVLPQVRFAPGRFVPTGAVRIAQLPIVCENLINFQRHLPVEYQTSFQPFYLTFAWFKSH